MENVQKKELAKEKKISFLGINLGFHLKKRLNTLSFLNIYHHIFFKNKVKQM